jgi:hypothetical protein
MVPLRAVYWEMRKEMISVAYLETMWGSTTDATMAAPMDNCSVIVLVQRWDDKMVAQLAPMMVE